MSNVEVVHIPENSRYEIHVDGEVAGFTEAKERDDGVVLFSHTVVDDEYEGQGLASQLVAGALDDIRRRGRAHRGDLRVRARTSSRSMPSTRTSSPSAA